MQVRNWVTCLLALAVAAQDAALSQHGAPPSQAVTSLRILVLEGDRVMNHIPTGAVTAPAVEVHNQDEMPVEGATVVFRLPDTGPGGYFAGGERSFTTITDSRGQAVARGFRINSEPGRFAIRVTASFQNLC